MFWQLANFTLLLEQPEAPLQAGETAYSVLGRSTSPCEIHELLRASGQMQLVEHGSSNNAMENFSNTDKESLGLVIHAYQEALIRAEQETGTMKPFEVENVSQELPRASMAVAGATAAAGINASNGSASVGEKNAVATSIVENKEWTIDIKRDAATGEPEFAATLVFRLDMENEVVTGQVWNGIDRQLLSTVKGTRKPLPGLNESFVALEFEWGDVIMTLSGTMTESDTVSFNGRYRATALTTLHAQDKSGTDSPYPMAPGDGDTGSGTGQQT